MCDDCGEGRRQGVTITLITVLWTGRGISWSKSIIVHTIITKKSGVRRMNIY